MCSLRLRRSHPTPISLPSHALRTWLSYSRRTAAAILRKSPTSTGPTRVPPSLIVQRPPSSPRTPSSTTPMELARHHGSPRLPKWHIPTTPAQPLNLPSATTRNRPDALSWGVPTTMDTTPPLPPPRLLSGPAYDTDLLRPLTQWGGHFRNVLSMP